MDFLNDDRIFTDRDGLYGFGQAAVDGFRTAGYFEQWHIAQAKMEAGVSEMKAKIDFVKAQKWLREGYGFCVGVSQQFQQSLRSSEGITVDEAKF